MLIESVEIENFRSVRNAAVTLDSLTAFVGRNGVGKSTLLYALDSFYNVGAQYSNLDYYNHRTEDASIRIRVTYCQLRADELAEFAGYIHNGKLAVTKVVNQGGARYYGTTAQIPVFAELRKMGAADKRNGLKARIEAGEFPDFPALPRKSDEVDQVMDRYETEHPEATQPIDKETQFFGPRNVGGGKLDKFTKFVLVPAVRDASSEMERRGAIMQLLDLIVTRSISSRRDFQEFKEQFEERARLLYGKENLPELAELGRLVTERLARYSPGAALNIDFGELKPPVIPLPDALVTVSEDDFRVPVRYSGHGLQRALILALLEQLSLTAFITPTEPQVDANENSPESAKAAPTLPGLILAIEEPELYLHPARSRYLAKILRDLAQTTTVQNSPGTQVIYVTHSPYFLDVEYFDQVRMCRKVAAVAGEPRVTKVASFSRLEASQQLASITGRTREDFTARSFVTRAAPILNSTVNEGLFADVAIVVEGASDATALWVMQSHLNQNWDELGVVVVPVGGKNNIDRAVIVFAGFGIPTYFVFDGDKTSNEGATTNRTLLRLGKETVVDYPDTQVGDRCACFENDIESYLQSVMGDRYLPLRDSCAERCELDRPSKALKNAEVMSLFMFDAHREGCEFPVLRDLVLRVTDIARQQRAALPPA